MSLPSSPTAHDPAADPFTFAPDGPAIPDLAASCGMPECPLPPPDTAPPSPAPPPDRSPSVITRGIQFRAARPDPTAPDPASASAGPDDTNTPPATDPAPEARALPLAERCWDLFCAGHSFSAIGRTLSLDRATVARSVRQIHEQVQADRRADRALALSRALALQERLQATAWSLLAQLDAASSLPGAADSPRPAGAGSGVRSPALRERIRLLALILASARETARLELLYDREGPARQAEQTPPEPLHIIIERVGDPYTDPLESAARTAPAAPNPDMPAPDAPPTPAAWPDAAAPGMDADPAIRFPTADPAASCGMPDGSLQTPTSPPSPASPTAPSPAEMSHAIESRGATPSTPCPTPPDPTPGWISLGDGSLVWGITTPSPNAPLPVGEGLGVRSARPRLHRTRFGLPVANSYPLG